MLQKRFISEENERRRKLLSHIDEASNDADIELKENPTRQFNNLSRRVCMHKLLY